MLYAVVVVVSQLAAIDPMYQFSLEYVSQLFLASVRHSAPADELAELAHDRQSWRATKHAIGSSKQCSKPPQSLARRMHTRASRRQLEFRLD